MEFGIYPLTEIKRLSSMRSGNEPAGKIAIDRPLRAVLRRSRCRRRRLCAVPGSDLRMALVHQSQAVRDIPAQPLCPERLYERSGRPADPDRVADLPHRLLWALAPAR